MDDFQKIYESMAGMLSPECRVPWVEDASAEGTAFAKAYADFWTAREHLCSRFNMEWEDDDLELFMNGILSLSEDIARRMFRCGMEYARRMDRE